MTILQKIQLFFTLIFIGKGSSFTFHAGDHIYLVSIVYTADHQILTLFQIIGAIESLVFNSLQLPYSAIVGNTSITISLVV